MKVSKAIKHKTRFYYVYLTDVKWNSENRISGLDTKSGSTASANKIRIYFLSFSSKKLHKKLPNVRSN